MSEATRKIIDREALRAALRELGVKQVEGAWADRQLDAWAAKLAAGEPISPHVDSERLGRCYNRYTSVTVGGTESDTPRGNAGNYRVVSRGDHPVLGPWVKTSCEVDSSD